MAAFVLSISMLAGCETAEEEFTDGRLLNMCDESYWICNVPAGCVVDRKDYVEGAFPGVKRLVFDTSKNDVKKQVRLFFRSERAPGTELLVRAYEADCSLNTFEARQQMLDVDIFEEADDDRTLIFNVHLLQEGEHLLELYSDASAEYLLLVD